MGGCTYTEGRELQPHNEDGLEREIPGKVVKNDAEREAFEEVEETEYDPVGEPLNVVIACGGLDSLHREIRGHEPANDVGNRRGEAVDGMQDQDEDDSTEEGIALRHLCALLERDESRIFGKLQERAKSVV